MFVSMTRDLTLLCKSGGPRAARRPPAAVCRRAPARARVSCDSTMPARHESVAAWWRGAWRALLAELLATALLVCLGLAAAVPESEPRPLAHVALAFGCVVAGNALAFGAVSGAHMNPAVSLAAAVAGRMRPALAAAYALAQCAGAALGFGALALLLKVPAPLGCTRLGAGVSPAAGVALEAALTFALALACCAAWAGAEPAAVPLGLLVAGLVFAGGPATGASLNPARSLGPALVHGHWEQLWVYWVGPLTGAALAAALHRWALSPRARAEPAPAPAELVPLADKP